MGAWVCKTYCGGGSLALLALGFASQHHEWSCGRWRFWCHDTSDPRGLFAAVGMGHPELLGYVGMDHRALFDTLGMDLREPGGGAAQSWVLAGVLMLVCSLLRCLHRRKMRLGVGAAMLDACCCVVVLGNTGAVALDDMTVGAWVFPDVARLLYLSGAWTFLESALGGSWAMLDACLVVVVLGQMTVDDWVLADWTQLLYLVGASMYLVSAVGESWDVKSRAVLEDTFFVVLRGLLKFLLKLVRSPHRLVPDLCVGAVTRPTATVEGCSILWSWATQGCLCIWAWTTQGVERPNRCANLGVGVLEPGGDCVSSWDFHRLLVPCSRTPPPEDEFEAQRGHRRNAWFLPLGHRAGQCGGEGAPSWRTPWLEDEEEARRGDSGCLRFRYRAGQYGGEGARRHGGGQVGVGWRFTGAVLLLGPGFTSQRQRWITGCKPRSCLESHRSRRRTWRSQGPGNVHHKAASTRARPMRCRSGMAESCRLGVFDAVDVGHPALHAGLGVEHSGRCADLGMGLREPRVCCSVCSWDLGADLVTSECEARRHVRLLSIHEWIFEARRGVRH